MGRRGRGKRNTHTLMKGERGEPRLLLLNRRVEYRAHAQQAHDLFSSPSLQH